MDPLWESIIKSGGMGALSFVIYYIYGKQCEERQKDRDYNAARDKEIKDAIVSVAKEHGEEIMRMSSSFLAAIQAQRTDFAAVMTEERGFRKNLFDLLIREGIVGKEARQCKEPNTGS